jgi:hypothetical protein
MTPKPALPLSPFPDANDLPRFARHPASVLGALGILTGILSSALQGPVVGDATTAPRLVLYMPAVGLWFGAAIAYGVWRWGEESPRAALLALAGTWIGWQIAANLAIQLDQVWLKPAGVGEAARFWIEGPIAGAAGALATWAGAAAGVARLRRASCAFLIVAAGAVAGLLLGWSADIDIPAALFVPWQGLVAAVLGACLAKSTDADSPK